MSWHISCSPHLKSKFKVLVPGPPPMPNGVYRLYFISICLCTHYSCLRTPLSITSVWGWAPHYFKLRVENGLNRLCFVRPRLGTSYFVCTPLWDQLEARVMIAPPPPRVVKTVNGPLYILYVHTLAVYSVPVPIFNDRWIKQRCSLFFAVYIFLNPLII